MNVDEMVTVFRGKYPGSTDEQVEFYRQACLAEQANPPKPVVEEPLQLMPVIVVSTPAPPPPPISTYTVFHAPHFISPPSAPAQSTGDLAEDLKRILLNSYNLRMSPAVQHRIRTENLTENELLELVFHYS